MTAFRIRFEGPAALAIRVATELADADDVELTSSKQPAALDEGTVRLDMAVDGPRDAVTAAVESIGADLPAGATLVIT